MTYQEKLDQLLKVWQEKVVAFSRANKTVLEMTGYNIPKIDRHSIEATELEEAAIQYKNLLSLIEQGKINPTEQIVE